MSESRVPSPKPEVTITDTEDDGQTYCPPPSGPATRSQMKKRINNTKIELDLSILLKFIKPYDGSRETLNSFLVNCNNAHELATDAQKDVLFKFILCQLQGKAQIACSIKEFTNWLQLKDFLKTQFSERKHYAHILMELQNCKQKPNESVNQYALKIEDCLSQLLTEISISHGHKAREMVGRQAAMEELALHHFQLGLNPRISNIVRCKSPKTLNEAINAAISEEKIQMFHHHQYNASNTRYDKINSSRPNITSPNRYPNQQPRSFPTISHNPKPVYPSNQICRYCKTPGHTLEQCRKREYNNNRFKVDQNPQRPQQRVHFVEDMYEEPTPEPEGYDTVDDNPKN